MNALIQTIGQHQQLPLQLLLQTQQCLDQLHIILQQHGHQVLQLQHQHHQYHVVCIESEIEFLRNKMLLDAKFLHQFIADMPDFMIQSKIVGGEAAPTMIPWQVALLSGSFQFCGGTVIDSCTILTAAHCGVNTGHTIRAGSITKTSGGQVILEISNMYNIINYLPMLTVTYIFFNR